MKLVVDANILFAALIKSGLTRKILLFAQHDFYSPEFVLVEFKKYFPLLQKKTGLSEKELNKLLKGIVGIAEIKFVSFNEFKNKRKIAERFSPDKGDVAYFALALHLKSVVWSNDKALKKQEEIKVLSTSDLFKLHGIQANILS